MYLCKIREISKRLVNKIDKQFIKDTDLTKKNSMEAHLNSTEMDISQQEEKILYGKASKRVQFKVHLMIFILTNLILWLFYYFGLKLFKEDVKEIAFQFILFVFLVWGIVVFAHYLIVYKWGKTMVEKEFDAMKKEHKKKKKALENKSVN